MDTMELAKQQIIANKLLNAIYEFQNQTNLPIALLQTITDLVKTASSCNDNELRSKAEKQIYELRSSTQPKIHLMNLFQIIYYCQTQDIKTIEPIFPYTTNYIRSVANFTSLDNDELIVLLSGIITCLIDKQLDFKYKSQLSLALDHMIDIYMEDESNQVYEVLEEYILARMVEYDPQKIIGLLLILKILLNSLRTITESYNKYLQKFIFVGNKCLEYLKNYAASNATTSTFGMNNDQTLVINNLKILHLLTDCIHILIDKYQNKIKDVYTLPLLNNVLSLFDNILIYNFNNDQNNTQSNHLICYTLDKNINDCINLAKWHVLKSIIIIFRSFYSNQRKFDKLSNIQIMNNTDIVIFFTNLTKLIIKEVHDTIRNSLNLGYAFTDQNDSSATKILNISVTFLSEAIDQFDYYNIFFDNATEIILDIILIIFLNTKEDYETFEKNPKEFVDLDIDIVENKSSNILKTTAALLFCNFCDKIDGVLPWIIKFLIQVICYTLGKTEQNYDEIFKFKDRYFISSVNEQNKLETALIALTMLARQISIRSDLVNAIDSLIKANLKNIFTFNSNITKTRICLMMKYYCMLLFNRDQENFKALIKFLFECLLNPPKKAVSIQALDTLSIIVSHEKLMIRIQTLVWDLIPYLCKLIRTTNDEHYFDFLEDFVGKYANELEKYSQQLINELCTRTFLEYKKLSETKLKTNIQITYCLRIIKSIISDDETVSEHYLGFEEELQHVFCLLDMANKIDFEEQLIEILNELIPKLSIASPLYDIVQRNFKPILEKNDYDISKFFWTFYNWCTYSINILSVEKPDLITDMSDCILMSLEAKCSTEILNEYMEFSQGCLLMQLLIQSCPEGQLGKIINQILESLDKMQEKVITYFYNLKFIMARLYQIYYCLMFYYAPETLRHLNSKKVIASFIDPIPTICLETFANDQYSKKVVSMGIMAILMNQTSAIIEPKYIISAFKILIDLLKYDTKVFENQLIMNKNKSNTSEIPQNTNTGMLISDNSNNNMIEEEGIKPYKYDMKDLMCDSLIEDIDLKVSLAFVHERESQIQKLIKDMKFPLSNEDEYKNFHLIFEHFKAKYPEFITIMANNLDEVQKKKLNDILNTKTCKVSIDQFKTRKILKVKHT